MKKPATLYQRLRQNPLLWNLLLIAAVILLLALVAHFVMQAGTRHRARRTVPDFSGMPLVDAYRLARRNDLHLQINDSLFVPAYEGGIVLDQLPQGGVEVKPGRKVYITINSFRQKMVPVPYVADRSLRQAKNMLEIAGLEIAELVYRADMATNYVLAEYCGNKPVTATSHVEAEMGSGITLHVGVEGGYGTTVVPQVVGYPLREAKSRLWELGLNVGEVVFDEDVDLLSRKDARVWSQNPSAERSAALGAKVSLRLSLDERKIGSAREQAERQARSAATERQRLEQERLDSLKTLSAGPPASTSGAASSGDDPFFD